MGGENIQTEIAVQTEKDDRNNRNHSESYPAGLKETEYHLAKWSILFPLLIAGIFFVIEVYSNYKTSSEEITVQMLLSLFNGYFDLTLLTSACFALLQQYFLYIPSGVDPNKGIALFVAFIVYLCFYVAYVTMASKNIFDYVFILLLSFIFLAITWYSLEVTPRQSDAGSFVGHK